MQAPAKKSQAPKSGDFYCFIGADEFHDRFVGTGKRGRTAKGSMFETSFLISKMSMLQ
jgi:hypothetical protein